MKRLFKVLCGLYVGILLLASSLTTEVAAMTMSHSQLVVDYYEIVEGKFEKSAECTIRVHIKNVDDDSVAMGGGITMHSAYVFPVTGQTNQIIFGEIQPGKSRYVDFKVNLDNIVNGPNLIEFALGWTDETGYEYTNAVNISPVLLEKVSFDITSVKVPETVYGKKNTTISVSYVNNGAENLQNVSMILEGDLAQGIQTVELEDIAAEEKNMTDCAVELLNMGANKILISFRYEDRNGTEYSTEPAEIYVTVTDKAYIAPVDQEMNLNTFFEEYRVYVIAAAAAVVLWIPLLVSLIVKRGKKR